MHNWFETKIKYEKNGGDGKITTVTESYLVDALSFTEAEVRITKEMQPFITGSFSLSTVKRSRISELFPSDNGIVWYNVKVNFISLDEIKGTEKRVKVTMFAQASSIKEACDMVGEGMKGTLSDYEIVSVSETSIQDIFIYDGEPSEII